MSRATTVAREVVAVYRDRDVPFLAGSVAYSAFVSLVPLVLLLLIAASVFGGEAFQGYVLDVTSEYLTPETAGVVEDSLLQATNQAGFSVFGVLALVWSMLKVFRTLDTAFAALYQAELESELGAQLRDGLVVFGTMAVAAMAMVAVGALLALAPTLSVEAVSRLPLVRVASLLGLVVSLAVVFLPMYYVFPDVETSVREALPGAVLAAVGWTLLQALFQVYVSVSSANQVYGAIGGVILFLTWLYFGAVVVLLGAATNVVLAGHTRPLTPGAPDTRSTDT